MNMAKRMRNMTMERNGLVGLIPTVGQEFDTPEDAYKCYNQYAEAAGFNTRTANCKKNEKKTEYRWIMFSCCKRGKTNERHQKTIKNTKKRSGEKIQGHTRCGCNARMTIKRMKDKDAWCVSLFDAQHNHPLTSPRKAHFLKSQRKVSKAQKILMHHFSEANIPTCQQIRVMENDSGGPSSMGCLEQDIRNKQRDERREMIGHDAESLIQYFEDEKERNENFYYAYDTDHDGVFSKCIWVDSESRNSFGYSGDVVVFDTTYNTNKYSMIFTPFVGVNHHRQTIIFGCGLLSDETTDSFLWLFSQFVAAMPGNVIPTIIITDQDQAIRNAIQKVFPTTVHRLCLWHIENKFSEKLGPMLYNTYKGASYSIVKSESPDEFEMRWGELMNTTELNANVWLQNMYEIRSQWVPAYLQHIFAAGMSSSQRVEQNHAFFKRYVHKNNSLMDFMPRFRKAIRHHRHEELKATHVDLNEVPCTVTPFHMEQKMAGIYTKKMFLRFQKELRQSVSYICSKIASIDGSKTYQVTRIVADGFHDRQRTLTWCTVSNIMTCSCQLFEFDGYPCRHILHLMYKKDVTTLPDHYILQRWTKNAKSQPAFEETRDVEVGQLLVSRNAILSRETRELVDEAILKEERNNFVLGEVRNLKRQVNELDDGGEIAIGKERSKTFKEPLNVVDPHPVRAKGSGK